MRRRITLVSHDAGAAHNCGLAAGLKKYGKMRTVWNRENPHGLDYLVPDAKYGYQWIPSNGTDIIIAGCGSYDRLMRWSAKKFIRILCGYNRVHIIISDGYYARNPDYYNNKFKYFDVITTACKRHFREPLPVKTYYQPFDLSHINQTKNDILTIAHSPFVKSKFKEKGTEAIISEVVEYDCEFDLITGVKWDECLTRKAKAHIFIDQIDHYNRDKFKFKSPDYVWPALGKSGIEAMHLGCLVITYGKGYDTEIPAPPVAWVTDNFKEVLEFYINNPDECSALAYLGYKWALKYASYDYQAKNVLR